MIRRTLTIARPSARPTWFASSLELTVACVGRQQSALTGDEQILLRHSCFIVTLASGSQKSCGTAKLKEAESRHGRYSNALHSQRQMGVSRGACALLFHSAHALHQGSLVFSGCSEPHSATPSRKARAVLPHPFTREENSSVVPPIWCRARHSSHACCGSGSYGLPC